VVIVPALRIDQSGIRLGQGGGYYDRALIHLKAWKIGLVYAGELSSEVLPHEPHDVPLDAAATPSIVVRFKR
jgi:5-formyltetrahydrofolate cyclo-ligase